LAGQQIIHSEETAFERSGVRSASRGVQVLTRPALEDYSRTLAIQLQLLEAKAVDPSLDDLLLFVEHNHVYTSGRGETFQSVGNDVPWFEVGRGGKATYHGPGQLVCYPIFQLDRHGRDVHVFLRNLEQALIDTLESFGVEGFRREGLTGIWVSSELGQFQKIASIGIGVKRWVSYHGLALNVSPDLSFFRAIAACGQDGSVMTSLAEILKFTPELALVQRRLTESMAKVFRLALPQAQQDQGTLPAARSDGRMRPPWLKVRAPGSPEFVETQEIVRRLKLVTVCEEARCPNMGECWSHHTATMMIMGELCTRRCSFCSVKDGTVDSLNPLDILEPVRVAQAVFELGLAHVVITSVNRDDLVDMGARHFNQTVRAIAYKNPATKIELLIPDMRGQKHLVEMILDGQLVTVLNHNLETVPSLYKRVRPGAVFKRSLNILRWAKEIQPSLRTKSGIMVGLGETRDEVLEVMEALREAEVSVLTVGQYLQPTPKQLPVERYITPAEFESYREAAIAMGFAYVESGPFVRSSYHAWRHSADVTDAPATLTDSSSLIALGQ